MDLRDAIVAINNASEHDPCALRHVIDGTSKCPDVECRHCAQEVRNWADGFAKTVDDARRKADWVDANGGIAAIEARLMPEGMSWPRFENGVPVLFGDAAACVTAELDDPIDGIAFYANGTFELCGDMNTIAFDSGERVRRPATRVLDADGVEIKVGDELYSVEGGLKITVGFIDTANGKIATTEMYGLGKWTDPSMFTHRRAILDANGLPIVVGKTYYGKSDGSAWIVEGINAKNKSHPIVARNASKGAKELRPEWLALTPPDTWERLYLDMGNGRMTVGEFERRCKALAEREAR